MMKEALTSKFNLLSGFMAIQSITGEMPELINSKKGVHPWKLRAGNAGFYWIEKILAIVQEHAI